MRYSPQLAHSRLVAPALKSIGNGFSGIQTSSLLLMLLFFSLLHAPFCAAQGSASLSGAITDQSGAAVSAAAITVTNLDTGISREVQTDQGGRYRIFALPVGIYEVKAAKEGFAEAIRSGVRLVVGQDASIDLHLRVGQVSEQIKVTEDAPVVNLTTQDISGLVGQRQVKDLPLNGRSYDLLLTLNPSRLIMPDFCRSLASAWPGALSPTELFFVPASGCITTFKMHWDTGPIRTRRSILPIASPRSRYLRFLWIQRPRRLPVQGLCREGFNLT